MHLRTCVLALIVASIMSGCGAVVYRSDALVIERHESLALTTCTLHRTPLRERVVGESGGFQYHPPRFDEIVQSHFPNSRRSVGGSCLVPHQTRMHVVKSCPTCEQNEVAFWDEQLKRFEQKPAATDGAKPALTAPETAPTP